jgi:Peptidase family M23
VAQSRTPCNRCVRFATTVTGAYATLATKRTLLLTWAGLAPAGSHQLCLAHSFNYLVGDSKQHCRYGDPERLGGLKVDHELELGRLHDRQIGGLFALENSARIDADLCDGWVVYAGQFRSYGQLLILNAGGGYHVLLAGMERISVDLGQFVLTGEPVAAMGDGPHSAAAIAIGSSQPVLYVEFRKDGTPVDPSPWWAISDSEKVRG